MGILSTIKKVVLALIWISTISDLIHGGQSETLSSFILIIGSFYLVLSIIGCIITLNLVGILYDFLLYSALEAIVEYLATTTFGTILLLIILVMLTVRCFRADDD